MALIVGGRTIMGNSSSNPTAAEGNVYWNSSVDELRVYTGSTWEKCNNKAYGTSGNPSTDPFAQIKDLSSGQYWVKPGGEASRYVYVNNTDNGGGWVLVARVVDNTMAHYNSGEVNISSNTGPTLSSGVMKLSDAWITALRNASSYSGTTAWWLQSQTWNSNNSYPANMFVSTSATWSSTDHANSDNERTRVSTSFEGSISDQNPNSGTRGLGDHHTNNNYFAWVRHPEASGNPGFRQDTRGAASGYLWVK